MRIDLLVKDYLQTIYHPEYGLGDSERIEIHEMLASHFGLKPSETTIITDHLPINLDFYDDSNEQKAFSLIFNGFQAISDMKKEGKQFKNIEQIKRYLEIGSKVFEK